MQVRAWLHVLADLVDALAAEGVRSDFLLYEAAFPFTLGHRGLGILQRRLAGGEALRALVQGGLVGRQLLLPGGRAAGDVLQVGVCLLQLGVGGGQIVLGGVPLLRDRLVLRGRARVGAPPAEPMPMPTRSAAVAITHPFRYHGRLVAAAGPGPDAGSATDDIVGVGPVAGFAPVLAAGRTWSDHYNPVRYRSLPWSTGYQPAGVVVVSLLLMGLPPRLVVEDSHEAERVKDVDRIYAWRGRNRVFGPRAVCHPRPLSSGWNRTRPGTGHDRCRRGRSHQHALLVSTARLDVVAAVGILRARWRTVDMGTMRPADSGPARSRNGRTGDPWANPRT